MCALAEASSPVITSSYGGLYSGLSSAPPSLSATPNSVMASLLQPSSIGYKRMRRSSSFTHSPQIPPSTTPAAEVWTSNHQEKFEWRIAHLTASANLPYGWVENPEWRAFLADFVPGAQPFSRKVLTNRIIPSTLSKMEDTVRSDKAIHGQVVTLHSDGWSGANHHHYQAFTLTAKRKVRELFKYQKYANCAFQSYPVQLADTSAERKTADNFLVQIRGVFSDLQSEWSARTAAFITDNSGESLAARQQISQEIPGLLVFPCYAHQVNLIVGDYLKKCGASFLGRTVELADGLITWLRSKTYVLALIQEIQQNAGKRTLTILRAVITRWIAHYLAYGRLLDIRPDLLALVANDSTRLESQLITGKADAKEKARKMIALIVDKDNEFWPGLARYNFCFIRLFNMLI